MTDHKYKMRNFVKFYDNRGDVYTGAICELHPEKALYLLSRPNWGYAAFGRLKEENIFHLIADACTEHRWHAYHPFRPGNLFTEDLIIIECKKCGRVYNEVTGE